MPTLARKDLLRPKAARKSKPQNPKQINGNSNLPIRQSSQASPSTPSTKPAAIAAQPSIRSVDRNLWPASYATAPLVKHSMVSQPCPVRSPPLPPTTTALCDAEDPRRTFPMGSHLSQNRPKLPPRPPQPRMVRSIQPNPRAQPPLQGALRALPLTHHGRGTEHGAAVPESGAF